MNSDKIEWCMNNLREMAFGGKSGFELDEIVPTLEKEISELKSKVEKLRKCVEFYADTSSWKKRFDVSGDVWNQFAIKDYDREQDCNLVILGGKLARQTLREVESEQA